MIVVEANGCRGYWDIVEQIAQAGTHEMLVQRTPPRKDWQAQISNLAEALRQQNSTGSLTLGLNGNGVDLRRAADAQELAHQFTCLPNVRASDCSVTQCCICINDVDPDETLVQLPCKHAFHTLCAARWLTQSRHGTCPLCVRSVCGGCEGELA